MKETFFLQKDNLFAIPILHYNMETAVEVCRAFKKIQPTCIAVELAETMEPQLLRAASRLPDLSIIAAEKRNHQSIYYLAEPCDASFEGLRLALDHQIPAHCIDLDIDYYPDLDEVLPDPYSLFKIGLKEYYNLYYESIKRQKKQRTISDRNREIYMAKRLKELCLMHEKVLFIGGMFHIESIFQYMDQSAFPQLKHASRDEVLIATLTQASSREVMQEWGWISKSYEEARQDFFSSSTNDFILDRQKLLFQLLKQATPNYQTNTGNAFFGYQLRNTMKFARNYALVTSRLLPDFFQLLSAAKGCVDHNFAYEVWNLATEYPYLKNIEGLDELPLTIEELWGNSKKIQFHLRQPSRKKMLASFQKRDKSTIKLYPPGPFTICSYQPEDLIVERFGDFLKKKGTQLLTEEAAKTGPFSSSIEDGIDTRETIRHWAEKKLYVKINGKPPGAVGSVVVIFNEDSPKENEPYAEKYPWYTTWIGEHTQESDMAFYATSMLDKVIGPGISRCEYGGFMMSYPPRRLRDVWSDSDYRDCRTKAEVLLVAAIDYAVKPLVVYVASHPPRSLIKSFARRFGKKIVYIPIGQLSPVTLNKLRVFHVLDGKERRDIAGEYIF
ncbi:Uncharacterized protein PHSC3_000233 [Chlamydiales bacterium STE3]|nr:Uncharacterized protein PHSC3_000233 [Chlamydiales bacterium STE3]